MEVHHCHICNATKAGRGRRQRQLAPRAVDAPPCPAALPELRGDQTVPRSPAVDLVEYDVWGLGPEPPEPFLRVSALTICSFATFRHHFSNDLSTRRKYPYGQRVRQCDSSSLKLRYCSDEGETIIRAHRTADAQADNGFLFRRISFVFELGQREKKGLLFSV